ncbi:MAG: GDSL-type esterase/lipase family protein [Bacillota bacterium]|nr:GDSL-type esterase/lipase family protein [Bacillota bacterium]
MIGAWSVINPGRKRTILCIGGSNTFGYDPRSYLGSRYPAEVRWTDRLAGWKVINCGVNGMTVPREAGVYLQAIRGNVPDLIIVMLGINDLLEGKTAAQTADRMESFLSSLSGAGIPILLIAPPRLQSGEWIQDGSLTEESLKLGEQYRELAERTGCRFADAGEWEIEMTFDGVHFSSAGHLVFAEKLEDCLCTNAAHG